MSMVRRRSWVVRAVPKVSFLILLVLAGIAEVAAGQRPTTNDQKQSAMHATQVPAFTVTGIEARTTNAKEASADAIIGKQWQKFFAEGIPQKIPNRLDQVFYAVYSDYASDHNGEYSFLIGAKVKEGTAAPPGLVAKHIQPGSYAVITSDRGPFPKVVPETWQRIFALEDESKLKRAYQTDFEVYDQRAQDPQNGQIDIYIGVK